MFRCAAIAGVGYLSTVVQFRFLGPAGKIEKNELGSEIPFFLFIAGDFTCDVTLHNARRRAEMTFRSWRRHSSCLVVG